MFIGHFALGMGLKKVRPQLSLGTLFLTVQFADLLWPMLLLLGIEQVEIAPGITQMTPLDFVSYPISHSLLMLVFWGCGIGLLYWLLQKDKLASIVVAFAVVSHWLLDLVMHRPDLPLYPGNSPLLGFGLWNSLWGSLAVELLIFGIGVWLYAMSTAAKNNKGKYGFWSLVIFLLLIHVANVTGPPPPSVTAIAWAGQLQWLVVIWGYWLDGNRTLVNQTL